MSAPSAHENQKDITSSDAWKKHPDFEFVSHFVRKMPPTGRTSCYVPVRDGTTQYKRTCGISLHNGSSPDSTTRKEIKEKNNRFSVLKWTDIKLRDCEFYKDEHKDCTSWAGRFRQKYIYGESVECNHFASAHKFCKMYRETGNEIALDFVIRYELSKRDFRIDCARANDIWEYRSAPPKEWRYPGVDTRVVTDLSGYEPLSETSEEVDSKDMALNAKEEQTDSITQKLQVLDKNNSAKTETVTKSSSSCVIS